MGKVVVVVEPDGNGRFIASDKEVEVLVQRLQESLGSSAIVLVSPRGMHLRVIKIDE